MVKALTRTIILSASIGTIWFSMPMVAEAGSTCNLKVKGSGLHSCQCEILVNHQASWQELMHLSAMNVCNSPQPGGGNGVSNAPPPPIIPIPTECDGPCVVEQQT
jgi:hypothetical protein